MPFGGRVISSTQALSPDSIPKKLVVVGGGYIGLELGLVYRKLGADVTVVEAQDRILPLYDEELTKPVSTSLRKLGLQVHLGSKVQGLNAAGDAVRVSELSAAFSHSIEMGAYLEGVAGTIHAHPTLGEAVQEAALRALGHALHV
jgi:dihydrolipoamide dehydrogenase